jgi:hypothetical protein
MSPDVFAVLIKHLMPPCVNHLVKRYSFETETETETDTAIDSQQRESNIMRSRTRKKVSDRKMKVTLERTSLRNFIDANPSLNLQPELACTLSVSLTFFILLKNKSYLEYHQ